jgi:hypothetical protein
LSTLFGFFLKKGATDQAVIPQNTGFLGEKYRDSLILFHYGIRIILQKIRPSQKGSAEFGPINPFDPPV